MKRLGRTAAFALSTLLTLPAGQVRAAPTETVLSDFGGNHNGGNPTDAPIFDTAGNLYGTTFVGGAHGGGLAFELMPPAAGQSAWTEKGLYGFSNPGPEGWGPVGGLVFDSKGNLYGTTQNGGDYRIVCMFGIQLGCGTVFELLPPAAGNTRWSERLLWRFDRTDGSAPISPLIFDADGNLYGTTDEGGERRPVCQFGCGTVFELLPSAAGNSGWSKRVLWKFAGYPDGGFPSGLIFDKEGNLYGAARLGGEEGCAANPYYGCGTVFELSPPAAGGTSWTPHILYSFDGTHGAVPSAGLIFDKTGNLYGTTYAGGGGRCYISHVGAGCGTVFELSPPAAGNAEWRERVLWRFDFTDGANPQARLIFDAAGNLYGTTYAGRGGDCYATPVTNNGCGTVFELSPPAAGSAEWRERVLWSFHLHDGANPRAGLIFDAAGNLYGTTAGGGPLGRGVVFEVAP